MVSKVRNICAALLCGAAVLASQSASAATISYLDTSLSGSQKYVLRWNGKPYYMTNIQIRLDKLRYWWGWDASMRDGIVHQAANDGFNTVSIPIHWYEVEPTKDNFNWTILDEYLGLVKKYNLRVELLWFSANSGGHVEWLGSNSNPIHLRTPDYVLYSPGYNSPATTSNYTVARSYSNYTVDITDTNYAAREQYVLRKVMAHIASWDAANGNGHVVVGMQMGNEVTGPWTSAQIVGYYSNLAAAVKTSAYSVWTRMNTVWSSDTTNRINANEALRPNTNIDFIGVDTYGASTQSTQSAMPTIGKNYKMIMESGAQESNVALKPLAALSGDTAYDHYDMISPDGHSLYDPTPGEVGATGWTPHNPSAIALLRTVNTVTRRVKYDLALNKKQVAATGLYVHNYQGNSTATTPGVAGVSFTPASTSSQGISIYHSATEIVLVNTAGGKFTYPSSLNVTGATQGYFDDNNVWVSTGNVSFTSTSITPPSGTAVRLVHQ